MKCKFGIIFNNIFNILLKLGIIFNNFSDCLNNDLIMYFEFLISKHIFCHFPCFVYLMKNLLNLRIVVIQ
jgi:hypothetical protein